MLLNKYISAVILSGAVFANANSAEGDALELPQIKKTDSYVLNKENRLSREKRSEIEVVPNSRNTYRPLHAKDSAESNYPLVGFPEDDLISLNIAERAVDVPLNAESGAVPEVPVDLAAPVDPVAPADPAAPAAPVDPVAPADPAAPAAPVDPQAPADPAAPVDPVAPADPAAPVAEVPAVSGDLGQIGEVSSDLQITTSDVNNESSDIPSSAVSENAASSENVSDNSSAVDLTKTETITSTTISLVSEELTPSETPKKPVNNGYYDGKLNYEFYAFNDLDPDADYKVVCVEAVGVGFSIESFDYSLEDTTIPVRVSSENSSVLYSIEGGLSDTSVLAVRVSGAVPAELYRKQTAFTVNFSVLFSDGIAGNPTHENNYDVIAAVDYDAIDAANDSTLSIESSSQISADTGAVTDADSAGNYVTTVFGEYVTSSLVNGTMVTETLSTPLITVTCETSPCIYVPETLNTIYGNSTVVSTEGGVVTTYVTYCPLSTETLTITSCDLSSCYVASSSICTDCVIPQSDNCTNCDVPVVPVVPCTTCSTAEICTTCGDSLITTDSFSTFDNLGVKVGISGFIGVLIFGLL